MNSADRFLNKNSMASWRQARFKAFLSPPTEQIFQSIAGLEDVWMNDPYDVDEIHQNARLVFSSQLDLCSDRQRNARRGRVILMLGDAGSGKTHLMGAFRREVEDRNAGYFTYAQMTTGVFDLWQYLLRHVVDCLQRRPTNGGDAAWLRISDSLVEHSSISDSERVALRDAEDYVPALRSIKHQLLEEFKNLKPDQQLHADFLSALLALQRRDGNANAAAMKYLRGNNLHREECEMLGCPNGLAGMGEAHQLFDWIIRAVRHFGPAYGGAFVLCVDQIEDLYQPGSPEQRRFPEMAGVVSSLTDRHPGLLVVIACLADYYQATRAAISPPHLDRIELDPPQITLNNACTEEQVLSLISRRLEMLDAEIELPSPPFEQDAIFPFNREDLAKMQGSRPRAVLAACYDAWRVSRSTGELPQVKAKRELPLVKGVSWAQGWNDFLTSWNGELPTKAPDFADTLAFGVNQLANQTGFQLEAKAAGNLLWFKRADVLSIAAICEASSRGRGLISQVESLLETARQANCAGVAIRSTAFAKSPTAKVFEKIAELVKCGGGRVIFPEADWRALQAWRDFANQNVNMPGFLVWTKEERPLAAVRCLAEFVKLEELRAITSFQGEEAQPSKPIATEDPSTSDVDPSKIDAGTNLNEEKAPIDFETAWFPQHLAVLGGTGSGKTTVAMTLLEGLLFRGIPVILVDRKGDLARYADANSLAALEGPLGRFFPEKVEVALYTPGEIRGRSLALNVLPAFAAVPTTQEIRMQAEEAALALASMLGYRENPSNNVLRACLVESIVVLLATGILRPTLEQLLDLMNREDPALIQALGHLDSRKLARLVQDVDSFRRLNARLLSSDEEPLDARHLLGLGEYAPHGGRARLTIISTKFLTDDNVVQFFVAQLMMELARFVSTHPSPTLQAAIMLDEADLYLPANSKPASKQPVENALRRFRSGGIGIVLASQSPGDFDYRCRENIGTWLIGKISQPRALDKLRIVFGEKGSSMLEKLGQHATGEFCLVRPDRLFKLKAQRNLLRTEQMSDEEILRAASATKRART